MNTKKKLVHKLDKSSRLKIVANYLNDKYKDELMFIESESNRLAENLIQKVHYHVISKESLNSLCSDMDDFSISNIFYKCSSDENSYNKYHVLLNIKNGYNQGVGFPFPIYKKNIIKIVIINDDYHSITCSDLSSSRICYDFFIEKNRTDDLFKLKNTFLELQKAVSKSFYDCYNLIKNIRTAELLIKHWPDSEKYLPNDLEVLNNKKQPIEEKFKLL